MGNGLTKTFERWDLNPRRFTERIRKRRQDVPMETEQHSDVHIYDTVPNEGPVYAEVKKKRPTTVEEKEIHYADVQVLQSRPATTRGGLSPAFTPHSGNSELQHSRPTEYASIEFSPQRDHSTKPTTQTQTLPFQTSPSQSADILIPPGALLRPRPSKPHSTHNTPQRPIVV